MYSRDEFLMQFFGFKQLPAHLQEVSAPFRELALNVMALPANPQRTKALEKLLEAKDCAVRARVAGEFTPAHSEDLSNAR